MGQHYASEYSNPGGQQEATKSEGVSQSLQASVSSSVAEAVEDATDANADVDADADADTPSPDDRPSWSDYDPGETTSSTPSEDLQGPDEYQNENIWDRSHRETGPDSRLNDTPTPPRNRQMGVSDWSAQPAEVPEPTSETPPDETTQDTPETEPYLTEDGVELGAGVGNELTADNYSMEDRIAAETDQDALADEAYGPSGNYASPEAGPDTLQNGMEFRETISNHLSENDTIHNPHLASEEQLREQLADVGLEEGMGTDGRVVPEEAFSGPDEATIREDAAAYADLHRMEIGGESVPRTHGSTLSQQESIEGTKNELLSHSESVNELADDVGEDKARDYVSQKTELIRDGVADDLSGGGISVDNSGPGPSVSKAQTETLLEQYPDNFNAREQVNERAETLAEKHDVSKERVKREIADSLLNDPDNKSVVHKGTRGEGETVPKLRLDDPTDYTKAGDEFRDALNSASAAVTGPGDPIPHSGFHKAVQDPATNQDGLRRGIVKGRVKGVVNEPTAKSDGIKQVAYLEDPDDPQAPDVKVSVWESNEHEPDHWGGNLPGDFLKHSPTLEQGQVVEIEEAKVYINRNAQNMNQGKGEPVASADKQARISILEDTDNESAANTATGQPSQDLSVPHPTPGSGADSGGDGTSNDRVDFQGTITTRGVGANEGGLARYFNDEGDMNYPAPDRR